MRKVKIEPGVVYRESERGRISERDYDEAIEALMDAKTQLNPDGRNCTVCHDGGHQAWECHHNPLRMARIAGKWASASFADMPWRCYNCNQVFYSSEEAEEHFGTTGTGVPSCASAIAV